MKFSGKMLPYLLKMMMKKTDTVLYPSVEAHVRSRFRGSLKFDSEKCIGCKLCVRVCPSNAIEIIKVEDKLFKAVVRLDKCIFCGQCVDTCPKDALKNTKDFELARPDRASLTVEI